MRVGVRVGLRVPVRVAVGVRVRVALGVDVRVRVAVRVGVRVRVAVRVAVEAIGSVGTLVRVGVATLQKPSEQISPSEQSLLIAQGAGSGSPLHSPWALQRSLLVNGLKSSHGRSTTMFSQRLRLSLQRSTVHWMLRSAQFRSVRMQNPTTQLSSVQNKPSSQSLCTRQNCAATLIGLRHEKVMTKPARTSRRAVAGERAPVTALFAIVGIHAARGSSNEARVMVVSDPPGSHHFHKRLTSARPAADSRSGRC